MDDGPAAALGRFQDAYVEFVSGFDPRALGPEERAAAIALLARVEKSVANMGALTAWLMAAQPVGKYGPVKLGPIPLRLAASRCAAARGLSADEAKRTLAIGERLSSQPDVAGAAMSGALSLAQAALVTRAAQADPAATPFLLDLARHGTLGSLAAECRRISAANEEASSGAGQPSQDGGASGQTSPERSLRSWVDRQDRWHLAALGTREDGERVMAAVQMFMPPDPEAGYMTRGPDEEPSPEACLDGLVAMAGSVTTDHTANTWQIPSPAAKFLQRRRRRRRSSDYARQGDPGHGRRPDPVAVEQLDWLFAPDETDEPGPGAAGGPAPP